MDETTHFIHGMFILCDASHFMHFHIHVYISNPFFICICIFLGQLQEWIRNRRTSTLLSQPQSMALSSAVARVIWFIFTYMHIFQIHFRIYVCFFLNLSYVHIHIWLSILYHSPSNRAWPFHPLRCESFYSFACVCIYVWFVSIYMHIYFFDIYILFWYIYTHKLLSPLHTYKYIIHFLYVYLNAIRVISPIVTCIPVF